MKYLLDTNVIEETIRKLPDQSVKDWIQSISSDQFDVSVVSLVKIRRGIEKLQNQPRKHIMKAWLENDLVFWFDDRVVPISTEIADKCGLLRTIILFQRLIPLLQPQH